uniref:Uncharacterized protein n=1 Tax=Anguilla anguilla TaxID=7936 RepID=A0A0E9QDT4_ANGAN
MLLLLLFNLLPKLGTRWLWPLHVNVQLVNLPISFDQWWLVS